MWVLFTPSNGFSVSAALDTLNGRNSHKLLCFSNFLFHVKNFKYVGCISCFSYVSVCICNSTAGAGSEEEAGGSSRQRLNRHGRDGGAAASGSLEKRMEELEKVRLPTPSFILLLSYSNILLHSL